MRYRPTRPRADPVAVPGISPGTDPSPVGSPTIWRSTAPTLTVVDDTDDACADTIIATAAVHRLRAA